MPEGSGFELLFDFLIKEISVPKQTERLIAVGRKVKGKPADELIRNYISFEHYLTNLDPEQKYTREKLRAAVKQRFPALVNDHFFSLLFDTEPVQKLKLVAIFIDFCLQEASAIFGNAGSGLFDQVSKQLQIAQQHTDSEASLQQMQLLIDKMFAYININFGPPLAERVFDNTYQKTARYYKDAGIIHYLAAFLPQSIVLSSLLSDLTQAQTQKVIREKMEETQRLNHVLEQRLKQLQQTRDEVKRQDSMLSGIISSSLDAMITVNEEGMIINWNRAAEEIFGYSYEEAKGQYLSDLIIPEEFIQQHKEGFNRFLRNRQSTILDKRMRLQARRKNNNLFPVELTITTIEHNNFCYFNGFLRDISKEVEKENELKQAREVAEQASRIKTEFLNTVSHEIRTPLNAIMGFTYQLLNGKVKSEEERTKYITYLRQSSETLLHLINDVLDFNTLENGGQQLNNETFHLRELLNSISIGFAPLALQKNIALLLQYDENIPDVIHGDGARLFAVLSNLVNNAIKFTLKGSIEIKAVLVESNTDVLIVDFMVVDTGIGIANEKQEKIFEYFIQGESDNTRRFGGAGLGLSIVRKTVQLMQGSIVLDSEPGKGSTFTIRIPLQHAKELLAVTEFPASDNAIFKGRKILIAEDNEFNIIVVQNLLEDWGATVDVAYNGQEALERCLNNDYHLVLMDLQMPEMDGLTSSAEIRKFNTRIPIIALTASSLEEIAEHVNTSNLNDYVRKPIDPNELYYKLCRYLPKTV
ncbi:PAS domain S-box-containing protein [Filimonas lacunae]|uniref:histidine kinase n=1 Tax=Filimonas lacunae TaxID=477680 RepID=A0A173MQB3_9BACT|nr:sensory box histidine kinase/response regulator [Filimonas lacunae]SIS76353.1 PAS domain S-box-containing protein [Filimonas lacunae]